MGLSPCRSVRHGLHQHRPCVWSSVPCWSTGDIAYPHRHHSAWKRNRPAITGMSRAASQWMRGLGVPPVLVVPGAANELGSTVPLFLARLRPERLPFRASIRLCFGRFLRTHALEIR